MKILITGVAGFIGFNVASKLLKNIKYEIYGIDNFDDYCRILKLFDGIEDPVSISWQELVSRLEKIY